MCNHPRLLSGEMGVSELQSLIRSILLSSTNYELVISDLGNAIHWRVYKDRFGKIKNFLSKVPGIRFTAKIPGKDVAKFSHEDERIDLKKKSDEKSSYLGQNDQQQPQSQIECIHSNATSQLSSQSQLHHQMFNTSQNENQNSMIQPPPKQVHQSIQQQVQHQIQIQQQKEQQEKLQRFNSHLLMKTNSLQTPTPTSFIQPNSPQTDFALPSPQIQVSYPYASANQTGVLNPNRFMNQSQDKFTNQNLKTQTPIRVNNLNFNHNYQKRFTSSYQQTYRDSNTSAVSQSKRNHVINGQQQTSPSLVSTLGGTRHSPLQTGNNSMSLSPVIFNRCDQFRSNTATIPNHDSSKLLTQWTSPTLSAVAKAAHKAPFSWGVPTATSSDNNNNNSAPTQMQPQSLYLNANPILNTANTRKGNGNTLLQSNGDSNVW
eukprot:g2488.t1